MQKAPAPTTDVRAMVGATNGRLIGVRNRALILLGFAGAFRRSELVGLDVENCAFGKDGLTVMLRQSKTDQNSEDRRTGIPYGANPETCPVSTFQDWFELAAITTGPLFRSINRNGQVQAAKLSGIDAARVIEKSWPNEPVCMQPITQGILCEPDTARRRPSRVRQNARLWPRLGIARFRWFAVTSGTDICFSKTARGK